MSVNLAKRSACDRCREHKVRCPRIEQNSNSCTRCLRARASCVTSSARPLGRPRTVLGSSRVYDRSHSRTSPSSSGGSQSRDSTLHTASSLSQTASTPSWLGADESHGLFDNSQFNNSPSDDFDGSSSWQLDGEYDLSDLPLAAEQELIPGLQEQGETPDALHNPMGSLPPVQPYPYGPSQQEDLVDPLGDNTPNPVSNLINVDAYSRHYQFHKPPETGRSIILLARLNESISRHLVDIRSQPWQAREIRTSCAAMLQTSAVNPIVSVLQSTSDFSSLLQFLRASSNSSSKSPSRDYDRSEPPIFPSQPPMRTEASPGISALDIQTVLMLLAAHLQLIQLFDTIFGRTYLTLRDLSYEEIDSFLPIAGLNIGGFPVTQGHLHVKMIFQVFEHHLQQIERNIGLPPEYRLFERQDSNQGILSNLASPVLLQAVMEQVNGTRGVSGVCHIASLKDNMQKVQGMLYS